MATCRYAELTARLGLLRADLAAERAPLTCAETATHRVRVESQEPGLAWWVIAEVCVMCAHMARDLPEFCGEAQPLRGHPMPILPCSPLPPAFEQSLRRRP